MVASWHVVSPTYRDRFARCNTVTGHVSCNFRDITGTPLYRHPNRRIITDKSTALAVLHSHLADIYVSASMRTCGHEYAEKN